jgi:hypothetical protein
MRCGKRDATVRITVILGKLGSSDEIWSGVEKRYDPAVLILPVCKICFRLYHLKNDATKIFVIILLLVGIGYAVYGTFAYGIGLGIAFFFGAPFLLGLIVYLPMRYGGNFLWDLLIGPRAFARRHPDYARLQSLGFVEAFYVDRDGKPQLKQEITIG